MARIKSSGFRGVCKHLKNILTNEEDLEDLEAINIYCRELCHIAQTATSNNIMEREVFGTAAAANDVMLLAEQLVAERCTKLEESKMTSMAADMVRRNPHWSLPSMLQEDVEISTHDLILRSCCQVFASLAKLPSQLPMLWQAGVAETMVKCLRVNYTSEAVTFWSSCVLYKMCQQRGEGRFDHAELFERLRVARVVDELTHILRHHTELATHLRVLHQALPTFDLSADEDVLEAALGRQSLADRAAAVVEAGPIFGAGAGQAPASAHNATADDY